MNKAAILLVILLMPSAFADYGKTYDLTATTTDWIAGSTISAMADDNISNVVFIGTSDGKLGYYNKTDNTSTDLTKLIMEWVGETDIFSMAFDFKDNRLYFTAGTGNAVFGYYDMNIGAATQLTDISTAYTLIEYDDSSDYLWFMSNEGTFGYYEIYGNMKNTIPISLAAGVGCIKYSPKQQNVYLLYQSGAPYDYGYPRVYHKSNNSFTDLSDLTTPNVLSCDLDKDRLILYVGTNDCDSWSGYFDINTSKFQYMAFGDLVVSSVTYMPSNDRNFYSYCQCWDGEPYGNIYNRQMNSSIYIENTDVDNWMVGQQIRKSAYNSYQRNLYVGLSTGGFGYYDNCLPSWNAYYTYCGIDDTTYKYYADANNCGTTQNLPYDNGTLASCNYCSENIVANYGACASNGTDNVMQLTYTDLNYDSCCAITGLGSDCSILSSPYNETTYVNCSVLTEDFEISYDTSCDMGIGFDRCYWNINLNATNSTFNCITYILTNESKLIQSNPVYTKKSDAIIQLKGTDYEDRTYFTAQNGIGSVYFTKENLIFDGREYIFGVQCANDYEVLTTEKLVVVGYENLNSPITRLPYLGDNATAIVAIIIGIVIVMILIFWIWRLSK